MRADADFFCLPVVQPNTEKDGVHNNYASSLFLSTYFFFLEFATQIEFPVCVIFDTRNSNLLLLKFFYQIMTTTYCRLFVPVFVIIYHRITASLLLPGIDGWGKLILLRFVPSGMSSEVSIECGASIFCAFRYYFPLIVTALLWS